MMFGVAKLSRSMILLSKSEGDDRISCCDKFFEFWWGFSIKFFVPFALWWLLVWSFKTDIGEAYGGYHIFWQIMGFLYPIGGILAFLLPICLCVKEEPFEHDVEAEFRNVKT